ncbi:glucose PTS transporter subunit EIIB [Escherichia coli]
MATNYIAAVGGTDNLKAIDACITRLRLTVADSARVNDTMCKRLGCFWCSKTEQQTIQVIVGAKQSPSGDAMKKVVARGPVAAAPPAETLGTAAPKQNRRLYQTRYLSRSRYRRLPVMSWHWIRFLTKHSPASGLGHGAGGETDG